MWPADVVLCRKKILPCRSNTFRRVKILQNKPILSKRDNNWEPPTNESGPRCKQWRTRRLPGGRPLPTRGISVRSQNIACFVCRAYTYISYYSYVALLAVYTAYATWFGPLERKSRVGQPAGTPLVATTNDSDFRAALIRRGEERLSSGVYGLHVDYV